MRSGIEILENGNLNEYANKMSAEFHYFFPSPDLAIQQLRHIGQIVVDDHNWPVLSDEQETMFIGALFSASRESSDFQFRALTAGSLDGVFEDVFDKIGKLFQDLLGTFGSVVGGGEGKEVKESLRNIVAESGKPKPVQEAAAGAVMVGAGRLKKTLQAMKAKNVSVHQH
jgi:hypothetical protein